MVTIATCNQTGQGPGLSHPGGNRTVLVDVQGGSAGVFPLCEAQCLPLCSEPRSAEEPQKKEGVSTNTEAAAKEKEKPTADVER